jgi:hypothetical protein
MTIIPFWTMDGTTDLAALTDADVSAARIADTLSKINRFNGRTRQPWSVAEHSVLVEALCPIDLKGWGLLHDAHEAFIGDISCRGTFSMSFEPKQIPKFRFSMTGLLGTILDAFMPAVSMTGWSTPVAVSKDATTMTLHGWSSIASKLSVDLGNTVTPRFLIGAESMLITDRQSVGEAVVDALSPAEMNWFTGAQGRTRGALSLVHGVAAGILVARWRRPRQDDRGHAGALGFCRGALGGSARRRRLHQAADRRAL